MPRIPLPLHTATKDGVELAFFVDVDDYSELDPRTWPTVAGIRAPAEFDAMEWHEDNLLIEYVIRSDPHRDAFQVYGIRIDRADDGDEAAAPVSGVDVSRVRGDYVLGEALAFFERVSRFDRLEVVPRSAARAPAPASRGALRKRRSAGRDELQLVADTYNSNLEQKPTEAVQDALGVSRSTADRRIREARKAGLITATAARGRKPQP